MTTVALLVCAAGCASTGPRVSREEITEARQQLDLKAMEFAFRQTLRVSTVGYHLVRHLPSGDADERAPFLGLLLTPLDAKIARLYNIPSDVRGAVVVGAVPESPAAAADVAMGDVITTVNGAPVRSPRTVLNARQHGAPAAPVTLTVWRGQATHDVALQPEFLPLRVAFLMTDDQDINATAEAGRRVCVTYGLMRFVTADDELAVILGHELAHHTRHHLPKEVGTNILTSVVGLTAAVGAEILVPGIGTPVMRGVKGAFDSTFSQDFEREADSIGLRYAYAAGYDVDAGRRVWERFAIEVPRSMTKRLFGTHPTSPERLLRMGKMAAALKAGAPSAPDGKMEPEK